MRKLIYIPIICLCACVFIGCLGQSKAENATSNSISEDSSEIIKLAGLWELSLSENVNLSPNTSLKELVFSHSINLPGTLDESKKGVKNLNKEVWKNLSREYTFEGVAFYKREIEIPEKWEHKRIVLRLERSRKTAVWLDGVHKGSNLYNCTSQLYELKNIKPGKHELFIAVDNIIKKHPAGESHMNTEATQTNWNGILGKIQLEATPKVWVKNVKIIPDCNHKIAKIELVLNNKTEDLVEGNILISSKSFNTKKTHLPKDVRTNFKIKDNSKKIIIDLDLGEEMLLWDEFDPALYNVKIDLELKNGEKQELQRTFGMRSFTQNGSQFVVNGNTTFLRGKHDGCVFPLTGYAPMEVEKWIEVFKIAKDYGINHYRFHTWTPPEAAFLAADIQGIYLQPELPSWGELHAQERGASFKDINAVAFGSEKIKGKKKVKYDSKNKTEAEKFYAKQAEEIFNQYGNYASFVMLGIGNELKGNRTVMKRLVDGFKQYDKNSRLYTQGANNYFRDPKKGESDDYWITVRTSASTFENFDNNVRVSYSFADQDKGGLINVNKPSTKVNFSKALKNADVPVIGHETGQYSYYPDYNEIKKYTGVTKAWNLELGKEILKKKGMFYLAPEFFKATGKWASILYCEDMESGIRTPKFGGFQLLDLQDFPGQGTALVGPLNAFMESKGTITPEKWREFSAPITILAEFDSYTLKSEEVLKVAIKIANYHKENIDDLLIWDIEGVDKGSFNAIATHGEISLINNLTIQLPKVQEAKRINLNLKLKKGGIVKSYPLWIYPKVKEIKHNNVVIADKIDDKMLNAVKKGKNILFIPKHQDIKNTSVNGLFISEFWSYRMFYDICKGKGVEPSPGTLGLLIDSKHPALKEFPTEYHTNWQWWELINNSRPIILDKTNSKYRPFVQTIDNMWRSHKLGTLFEFKVGNGKVLISAIDLNSVKSSLVGNSLYHSIINYMNSEAFNPQSEIEIKKLKSIIYGE